MYRHVLDDRREAERDLPAELGRPIPLRLEGVGVPAFLQ